VVDRIQLSFAVIDTATGNPVISTVNIVMNIGSAQHGARLIFPVSFFEFFVYLFGSSLSTVG
jgi:hypothetical protein